MMQGHEVTVADNFFTGRKRNVEHWIGHENFELLNHDIVSPLYIEGISNFLTFSWFIFIALHRWNQMLNQIESYCPQKINTR